MTMLIRRRKIVLGILAVAIALPLAMGLLGALFFHALNPVLLGVSDQTHDFIVSSGRKREYVLYVPRTYDRAQPTPLVISMHAAALWPAAQMEISQWNKLADQYGLIVVYPSGIGIAPVPLLPRLPVWRVESEAGLKEDVRFISELIDRLEVTYNIDPARIYANGFSNGGAMAFVLSCTLSDRIAAVGTVAAAQALPWSWCKDDRVVPMIAFHGTADGLVPYRGGSSWAAPGPFPSVPVWAANWARRNRCGPNPVESVVAADVTRVEYTNCAEDAAVVLYSVQGGGHSWPGGKPIPEWMVGPTSNSIDATGQMWAFFRLHRLPRK